jgi:uncharacterized protein (DUF1697 family)
MQISVNFDLERDAKSWQKFLAMDEVIAERDNLEKEIAYYLSASSAVMNLIAKLVEKKLSAEEIARRVRRLVMDTFEDTEDIKEAFDNALSGDLDE